MLVKLSVVLATQFFTSTDVAAFEEVHEVGTAPALELEVWLDEPLPLDLVVGTPAELVYGRVGDEPRRFRGVIESVELGAELADEPLQLKLVYRLRVISEMSLLAGDFGNDIFQDLTVKEIVTSVLESHGIAADRMTWRLSGSYPKREYCVRYQETALDFVHRLLEAEGIGYFVEPGPEGSEGAAFTFYDQSSSAPPIDFPDVLPMRDRSELIGTEEAIYGFEDAFRVRSGTVTLRDFDFEHPAVDLTATVKAAVHADLEVYDYPGGYFEPSDGKRLAQTRLEELGADARERVVRTDAVHVRAGRKLEIEAEGVSSEWFVVATQHRFDTSNSGDRAADLEIEARLVPLDVPHRPPRRTPKPVIDGPETATVMAPQGSPAEEIHTDEHGRCRVRFHWDRSPLTFERSSCWMRVAQLQTSGSMVLPRYEWEVLIEFLEGDPDRPVATGRVYNGMFMPPYQLPEGRTRTVLRTNSSPGGGGVNEIRIEDKAGAEEIAINSQYNTNIAAANNRDRKIANNETVVIGNNATIDIGANTTVKIGTGWSHTTKNQTVTVGGNRKVEVNAVHGLTTGSATFTVGGNQMEMDGNPLAGLIATVTSAVTQIAAAKAAQVVEQVNAAVQGKVSQALGPVQAVAAQAGALGGRMQAAAGGSLGAAFALGPAAAGLPSAGALAASIGSPPAATRSAPGGGDSAGEIAVAGAIDAAVTGAVGSALAKGKSLAAAAFGGGGGSSSDGAGGSSVGNQGGPAGAVAGVSEADSATGPGHSQYKIGGAHSETVGALRVAASAGSISLNVTSALSETVGAAHLEACIGDRSESVEGVKSETALGLVIVSLANDSETAKGARNNLVGGAMLEKVKGSYTVEAGAAASFVGAAHKLQAKSKITFKCGASSVVIDGSGIVITSPMVTLTAATIQHTKSVNDG